jgi:hypothetical protein
MSATGSSGARACGGSVPARREARV